VKVNSNQVSKLSMGERERVEMEVDERNNNSRRRRHRRRVQVRELCEGKGNGRQASK